MSRQWTPQHGKVLLAVSFDPELVGERIAAAREAKHWTQLDFALAAGVSPSTVQRWEAGKLPPVRRILKVAEILEVEADELIEPRTENQEARHLEELVEQAEAGRAALIAALTGIDIRLSRIEQRLELPEEADSAVRP